MPWSSNKGFSTPATGTLSGTWGSDSTTPTANSSNALNEGLISLVDQALGGITSLSLASTTPINLTQLQTQNGMLRMTGVLLANIVVQPTGGVLMTGFYYFENLTTGSFTVTLTNSAGSVVLPQSRRGIAWIDATNGPRIVSIVGSTSADPIPVGTVMLFYQNAAPTGWTISTALDDYALKIVPSAGGVTSGSVLYSTLFGRTATDAYALVINDLPPHTHPENTVAVMAGSTATVTSPGGGLSATGSTGAGIAHSHPIDMRVRTASIILASKN